MIIRFLLLSFFCCQVVFADGAPAVKPKSPNMTINLINRLVEKGVLSAEDAKDLIDQAEKDAAEARAQASQPGSVPATNDTVSVRYVPEIVKAQIRDEIKADVMQQARAEHWMAPNSLPAWVAMFNVYGDIRVRYEGLFYPSGNDNTGAFPNFNAINTGSPFDTTGTSFPPERNVDQDRNRFRLVSRLGAGINLDDGFTAGLRLATGENNSPVTANQSLGAANNAQGGNFSKYAIWLDRAFIKYEVGGQPTESASVTVGRFDNPFMSTSVIWGNDLGFDGIALRGKKEVVDGVVAFGTAGAFPVFNTDLNFSSNRPEKYPSTDKYLYGGQLGIDWKINRDFNCKLAGAFYYFENVAGKLSQPYVPLTAQDQGNTDGLRPAFAQYGNTYMELRNITPTAANNFGTINQWQYYGLATPFQDLAFTGRQDYKRFEPFNIALYEEFIINTAYDEGHINSVAVNNRGTSGSYGGGNTAWIVGTKLGAITLQKRWDWNCWLEYRYVESDSVIDGFCESDFGGGGTNVKGYSVGGALALSPKIFLALRWMSSDQIAGPTLKADTVQFDVNAKW
ncbi:MAG: putative porin [Verrucomicrobiota bacterium]